MPDMYRSPSLEIYSSNSFLMILNARLPVVGTIPEVLFFDYDNNLEDYLLAGNQLKNPSNILMKILKKVKSFIKCLCSLSRKNGDGEGDITHPVYGAILLYSDDVMIRRTGGNTNDLAGHIYHAIYYGLNAMGPHNSQINDTERWLITICSRIAKRKLIKIKLTVYVHSIKKYKINFL